MTEKTYLFDRDSVSQRDVAIFGKPIEWSENQIMRFEGLTLEGLDFLIANGHADPTDYQNHAPSIQKIRDFMAAHEGAKSDFVMNSRPLQVKIRAHGYAVSPGRSDYRISIEGVEVWDFNSECFDDFLHLFRHADDFRLTSEHGYCWFD